MSVGCDPNIDLSGKRYRDGFFDCLLNGFLPATDPLNRLPEPYQDLQQLLDQMSIHQPDGNSGYLAVPGLIDQKINDLENKLDQVQQESDMMVVHALFRAYCFLASAFLLEPSYQEYVKTGKYGKGQQELPANLAQPFCYLADKLGVFPWMEYSYGYSLGNYTLIDQSLNRDQGRFDWNNLRMANSFSRTNDENGFIMVHVDLNQYTRDLVQQTVGMLAGCGKGRDKIGTGWHQNELIDWLSRIHQTLEKINLRRREMWRASDHHNYNNFRVFIMGIKGNTQVFGEGVRYQGINLQGEIDDSATGDDCYLAQFRGQSGSQDSVIPMLDTVFRVIDFYPQNELTEYLMDMRQYRPQVFRNLLQDFDRSSVGLMERAMETGGVDAMIWYLAILDQIYLFRNGHWQFVQKYIMANTRYPVATGGTPIISWIPNQIEATLMAMKKCLEMIQSSSKDQETLNKNQLFTKIQSQYPKKVELLNSQLMELRNKNYNVELIYQKNLELNESDILTD